MKVIDIREFIINFKNKHPILAGIRQCDAPEFLRILCEDINYDLNEVRLFTKFDNGGYFEYRGIKCYIDGRAELFLKKFNHKEEIMDEYYEIFAERLYDYEAFLNKYHFTHLFVDTDSDFHDYLMESDDYEVVYNDWFDEEETFAIRKLFAYVGDNKEK